MNRALITAHAHKYVLTLVEEGASLVPLLQESLRSAPHAARGPGRVSLRKYDGKLLELLPRNPAADTVHLPISVSLTPQERRVLQHFVEGADNRGIAEALSVSVETVKRHCRHLYRKLGVQNRKEAVELCARLGQLE